MVSDFKDLSRGHLSLRVRELHSQLFKATGPLELSGQQCMYGLGDVRAALLRLQTAACSPLAEGALSDLRGLRFDSTAAPNQLQKDHDQRTRHLRAFVEVVSRH